LRLAGHKTTAPLDLIFSDVWCLATLMVFFTLLSLSMHIQNIYGIILFIAKSDVFSRFHCFQVFIERQFSCKIKFVQTDWGGEYRKLNNFF
jgi:hypothetical protein